MSIENPAVIKEFKLADGCVIRVFQGNRGANKDLDIRICYKDRFTKRDKRTPAHIHWTIDLLIKKEHQKILTLEFVKYLRDMWDGVEPFKSKKDQQECKLKLTSPEKLKKFIELNEYGEYSVEFIGHIIELLMIQEKTGLAKAFMFKKLLDALIEERDIFTIVSKATYNGR